MPVAPVHRRCDPFPFTSTVVYAILCSVLIAAICGIVSLPLIIP